MTNQRQSNKIISIISPFLSILRSFKRSLCTRNSKQFIFTSSSSYWESRYLSGGTSGPGSYNNLAEYKAKVLNNFVRQKSVSSVIEFGCGDGNQLSLAKYPKYVGFDVSDQAVKICKKRFSSNNSFTFANYNSYNGEIADLTLSLDVIFHLVEDDIFEDYMYRITSSSTKYLIIYSSNFNSNELDEWSPHIRHRNFTAWMERNAVQWQLEKHLENPYPYDKSKELGSFAEFYIYSLRI